MGRENNSDQSVRTASCIPTQSKGTKEERSTERGLRTAKAFRLQTDDHRKHNRPGPMVPQTLNARSTCKLNKLPRVIVGTALVLSMRGPLFFFPWKKMLVLVACTCGVVAATKKKRETAHSPRSYVCIEEEEKNLCLPALKSNNRNCTPLRLYPHKKKKKCNVLLSVQDKCSILGPFTSMIPGTVFTVLSSSKVPCRENIDRARGGRAGGSTQACSRLSQKGSEDGRDACY